MLDGGVEDKLWIICFREEPVNAGAHRQQQQRHVRELLGEFWSDEASEDVEKVLASELRREWKGRSELKLSGVSRSASYEPSDMATSLSTSAVGNANRFARLVFCGDGDGALSSAR